MWDSQQLFYLKRPWTKILSARKDSQDALKKDKGFYQVGEKAAEILIILGLGVRGVFQFQLSNKKREP